jgi:hypothetical protein
VVKFNAAANAVEGELANVFKGMGATDQEIKSWREQLSTSQSPEQLHGAIKQVTELLGGRMDAPAEQYKTGMGRAKDFHLLSPTSVGILHKLGADEVITRDRIGDTAAPSASPSGDGSDPFAQFGGKSR